MTVNPINYLSGRRWAYIGAALGGTASVAANIAHSFVPPAAAAVDWSPKTGAVIAAMFWPVALFVATEILTRVAWPSGWTWQLLRWAGMLPVAAVAALVSYRHLSGLLAFYGEDQFGSVLGPLAVDGLMVIATGAILATGTSRPTNKSVSAPAAPSHITVPVLAPTLPAVPTPVTAPEPASEPKPTPVPAVMPEPVPATRTDPVPTPAQVATRVTPSPTTIPLRPTATSTATADVRKPRPRTTAPTTPAQPLAASATDTPVTAPKPAQLALPMPVDPDLLAKAREIAKQYRTETGSPIKAGQLAARLRVNSETATQALAVLDLGPDSPTTEIATVNGSRLQKATTR
jgi:outer membrane biosynthesis protein TonB